MARFLLSLLLLSPGWASEPTKVVMFGRGYQSDTVPTFDQGYLLFNLRTGGFQVFGLDGLQRFFGVVENPAGASLSSLAADSDGSIAVGLAFPGPQGYSGGIAYFDSAGKQTRFIDTGEYRPAHVCFDRDHSLWTFGEQRDSSGDREEPSDYMMFRKYSADGKEAGRYGPRSILPLRGLTPGGAAIGAWRLRVADDRVGALAGSGRLGGNNEFWIELGLDGHLIGKWALGRDSMGGFAFTNDARLCRQTRGKTKPGIECLDRDVGVWKDAGEAPVSGVLLGAQGNEWFSAITRESSGSLGLRFLEGNSAPGRVMVPTRACRKALAGAISVCR